MRRPSCFHLSVATIALTLLSACNSEPPPSTGAGLDIRVAPLDLPGIAFACYDVTVRNGALEPVWQRGEPGLTYPNDPSTLCSTQFGNGAGGTFPTSVRATPTRRATL